MSADLVSWVIDRDVDDEYEVLVLLREESSEY
jgi:hypothetical protein